MNTRNLIALSSLILCLLPELSVAQATTPPAPAVVHCQVSAKNDLARDQRDAQRMECLKQSKVKLSIPVCLKIASSMEYSTAAEEARLYCLQTFVQTAQQCFAITKTMEYPDSGDESRWDCLRRFAKSLSKKQCLKAADQMSYPANADRAEEFCKQQHD